MPIQRSCATLLRVRPQLRTDPSNQQVWPAAVATVSRRPGRFKEFTRPGPPQSFADPELGAFGATSVTVQRCVLPVLAADRAHPSRVAPLSLQSCDATARPFHLVGSRVRMSWAPACQRSSRNVAAAILSGTCQLAGRARAIGPEKHTHTILADLQDRGIAAVIPPKRNRRVARLSRGARTSPRRWRRSP